jgi:hypothetical protein
MRRLAEYALNYISGSGFVPIEEVDHTIEGPPELWEKLREQALQSC